MTTQGQNAFVPLVFLVSAFVLHLTAQVNTLVTNASPPKDGFVYKIAPHTIDSSDSIFDVGYVRSLQSDDWATAGRLRGAYADFVMAGFVSAP
jgi:hypothetical protein